MGKVSAEHTSPSPDDAFEAIVQGLDFTTERPMDTLVDDFDVVRAMADLQLLKERMYDEAEIAYTLTYSSPLDPIKQTRLQIDQYVNPDPLEVAAFIGDEEVELYWDKMELTIYGADGQEKAVIILNPEDDSYVYEHLGTLADAPNPTIEDTSWQLFELCTALAQAGSELTGYNIENLDKAIEAAEEHMDECSPGLVETANAQEFTHGICTVSYYRASVLKQGDGFQQSGNEIAEALNVTNEDTDIHYVLVTRFDGTVQLSVLDISEQSEPVEIKNSDDPVDLGQFSELMDLLAGIIGVIKDPEY
jgi:hypothetical protein